MYSKNKRILTLLDEKVLQCEMCSLHKNGRCKPFWTYGYRGYFIIGEAPGKNEVDSNEPFIGSAGNKLWECAAKFGIEKEHCFIINSTNCRPVNGNRNGKPTELQMDRCREWLRKYLKILQPKKILLLGNYAMYTFLNEWGIMKKYENGGLITEENRFGQDIKVVRSVHPSMCIYQGEAGKEKLLKSLELFYEI